MEPQPGGPPPEDTTDLFDGVDSDLGDAEMVGEDWTRDDEHRLNHLQKLKNDANNTLIQANGTARETDVENGSKAAVMTEEERQELARLQVRHEIFIEDGMRALREGKAEEDDMRAADMALPHMSVLKKVLIFCIVVVVATAVVVTAVVTTHED
ncbi:hypothetical protein DIPPA_12718 [Diplonema papillatum]|nr:hypothetical protein DIPPA_12718 [Diplonema papillatum]